jgi:hypothetical protein
MRSMGNKQLECPSCALEIDAGQPTCPYCGYEFPADPASRRWMAWLMAFLMILPLLYIVSRFL